MVRFRLWWEINVEYPLERFVATRWLAKCIYLARRWLSGARRVSTADLAGTGGVQAGEGYWVSFGGACPVQGEGEVDGRACYYRSRGEGWQFHVAPKGSDDVYADGSWAYWEDPYYWPDGSWVSANVSEECIKKAVRLFRNRF